MPMLLVDNLSKSYGDVLAVNKISLEVDNGEMLCLLGPSGCGKTTLLLMLSGFLSPDTGSIFMDGRDVTNLVPEKRPSSLVFQNYALFPHLTVFENIAFGLRVSKRPLKEIRLKVSEMLETVGLTGKDNRAISQLSGGQQQRVALARALIMKPKVLLLDEPLSNLDAKLRVETREQIRKIQRNVGITSIFVTHDQEEALTMADKVAVMKNGNIEQYASPEEVYYNPSNTFVADFIGKSNILKGEYLPSEGKYRFPSGKKIIVDNPKSLKTKETEEQVFIIRPEHISIAPNGLAPKEADNCLNAEISSATFLGEHTTYSVDLGIDGTLQLLTYGLSRNYSAGDKVDIFWNREKGQILGL